MSALSPRVSKYRAQAEYCTDFIALSTASAKPVREVLPVRAIAAPATIVLQGPPFEAMRVAVLPFRQHTKIRPSVVRSVAIDVMNVPRVVIPKTSNDTVLVTPDPIRALDHDVAVSSPLRANRLGARMDVAPILQSLAPPFTPRLHAMALDVSPVSTDRGGARNDVRRHKLAAPAGAELLDPARSLPHATHPIAVYGSHLTGMSSASPLRRVRA
jgi:hypothetical protein